MKPKTYFVSLLKSIEEGGGATLEGGETVTHADGYQVATEGIETESIEEAAETIETMNGNAGIWKENGIYYIDKSHHESDKATAVRVGKQHNQISIYDWATGNCIYL